MYSYEFCAAGNKEILIGFAKNRIMLCRKMQNIQIHCNFKNTCKHYVITAINYWIPELLMVKCCFANLEWYKYLFHVWQTTGVVYQ